MFTKANADRINFFSNNGSITMRLQRIRLVGRLMSHRATTKSRTIS